MAKKNKKGIGSYLVVLLLAILATFLIIITIMLFSPFNNILGFKYFTYNSDKFVFNVTGGKEGEYFDLQTIENINIDSTFATIKVERYYDIDTCAFKFENNMSGFAREDQDTDFTYEVYYTDNTKKELNVEVHEPEGMIFFSKNVTVSLLIPISLDHSLNYTSLNISNTTGDIYLGNKSRVYNKVEEDFRNYITFNSLNVNSSKGNVFVLPFVNEKINDLFVNIEQGSLEVKKNLTITNDCQIYSNKGELEFKDLVIENNDKPVQFNLSNSEFSSTYLKGNIDFSIKEGYFDVDKMDGALSSNNAVTQMSKPTITIKEFTGFISLPFANKAKINLGIIHSGSEVYIHATEGNIKINKMYGDVAELETKEGNVNVYTYGSDIDVKTVSGNINVTFDSDTISNKIDLVSKSGEVNLKVKSDLAFLLTVKNYKGELRDDKNIKVSWLDTLTMNPLPVLGGVKEVNITSNEKVNIGLIY